MSATVPSPTARLPERFALDREITGFEVEALDGLVGTVDAATYDVDTFVIVVALDRPGAAPKRVALAAREIELIDTIDRKVWVARTRAEVEAEPAQG